MMNKTSFLLLSTALFLTPYLQANTTSEPIIVEEWPDIYQECLADPSVYDDPSVEKVFEAHCTSSFYFHADDQGDFPDPIIQDIVLSSHRSTCDRELFGAQLTYLPDFDTFQRPEIFQRKTAAQEVLTFDEKPSIEQEVIIIDEKPLADKRLWLLVTDGLPQQSLGHTSVAELIISPNLKGVFVVGTNSDQGQRRLECELKTK